MNLAINGTCSKGCSFCFTKEDYRLNHTLGEMSLEMVEKIINHFDLETQEELSILGGEPTQHSKFTEIVDLIVSKNITFNLVSNLLFRQSIRNHIIENIRNIRWILPNGSELDEKNRIHLFKKNYLELYHAYQNTWGFETNPRLFISLTLSKDWKERDLYEYIKWLYGELDGKINAIRLGLDLTGTYLINNKELGEYITKILKFGKYNGINISSDCQVPPCMWEGNTKEAIIENSLGFATIQEYKLETICGFMPLDVFPDGSSIHCYPLQDKVKVDNIFDVSKNGTIDELRNKFDSLYIDNHKNYNIPKECRECVFYSTICNGICAGCLENEKI